MKYTVPVICNLVGWIEIEADSKEEAKKKAQQVDSGEKALKIADINVTAMSWSMEPLGE